MLPGARVARVFVDKGDVVAPGTPLVELIDDRKVRVMIRVPQNLATRVHTDDAVKVQPPGDGTVVAAKVASVRGVIDGDGCMGVEVVLDNKDGRWLPGMTVKAELQLAPGK